MAPFREARRGTFRSKCVRSYADIGGDNDNARGHATRQNEKDLPLNGQEIKFGVSKSMFPDH